MNKLNFLSQYAVNNRHYDQEKEVMDELDKKRHYGPYDSIRSILNDDNIRKTKPIIDKIVSRIPHINDSWNMRLLLTNEDFNKHLTPDHEKFIIDNAHPQYDAPQHIAFNTKHHDVIEHALKSSPLVSAAAASNPNIRPDTLDKIIRGNDHDKGTRMSALRNGYTSTETLEWARKQDDPSISRQAEESMRHRSRMGELLNDFEKMFGSK